MEIQYWIIGQIVVDFMMLALLLWFLRVQSRHQLTWQDHEAVIQKSASILSEMREISLDLEKNLEEKRALSQHILDQLDQGLEKAEESYHQLSGIIPASGRAGRSGQQSVGEDGTHTRSSVMALLDKGLSKEEIGRHLGISVGEIELMLKLNPPKTAM